MTTSSVRWWFDVVFAESSDIPVTQELCNIFGQVAGFPDHHHYPSLEYWCEKLLQTGLIDVADSFVVADGGGNK